MTPEMAVVRRFLQPPSGGFFLFGPRGTGKSTWLAQPFPGACASICWHLRAVCQLRRRGERLSFWRIDRRDLAAVLRPGTARDRWNPMRADRTLADPPATLSGSIRPARGSGPMGQSR